MTQEKNNNNNNILMIAVIVLLLIIAVMGFFLGKNSATVNNGTNIAKVDYEALSIQVIEDKRCTSCPTDDILDQLIKLPSISSISIERKDFSDEGVEQYLKDNNITTLPLIVFSTNNFDTSTDPAQLDQNGQQTPKINTFLQSMGEDSYFLPIGSTFNPFEKRSDRGFLLLDKSKLEAIKSNSYIEGNSEAKITWIEYSDLECPYCAKLHNSGTPEELKEKYGDDLNIVFNHFPLNFHANAQVGAEVLECAGEEKGSEVFYALVSKSFTVENAKKSFLIEEAVNLGASEDFINKCLDENRYTDKVKNQMETGGSLFGVTGTPGNVLVNNETGEYEVISGAYPTSSFVAIIDRLLK